MEPLRTLFGFCILYWAATNASWGLGMRLDTSRFGTIDVDENAVITFTQPIIGFQEFRRFIRLPGPDGTPLTWLQSAESPELAFLLVDPRRLVADYEISLDDHELVELAVSDSSELDIHTLVVVPQDRTKTRTNLKAPILINPKIRLGKQTILEHSDYPVRFYLTDAENAAPQEVSNARTHP